jgi:predicted DNA-binding transcriptional regulator YafY
VNIRIHTFSDPLGGGSVWAVALTEGCPVTDGALASGSDDRSASNAALAAFWKREDNRAQAEASESPVGKALMLATTPAGIREMLGIAISCDPRNTLLLNYRDRMGNRTSRLIVPSQITGDLVTVYDITRDDARTFRIDRIESVEVVR